MAKTEQTSPKAGKAASKVLRSGSTGKDSKTAAIFGADTAGGE